MNIIFAGLRQFWEKSPPLKSLAIFRILLAAFLIWEFLFWGNQSAIFFSSEGLLSLDSIRQSPGLALFSIFRLFPDTPLSILLIGGVLFVALIGVLLGFCLPVCSLISWVILMSLRNRDPYILNGGHEIATILLFLLSFSAADRRWSLRSKRKADDLRFFHSVSYRFMQIQICVLYLSAFLNKIQGRHWRDGTFLFYVGQQTEILRPWALGFFENPALVGIFTYGTLLIELALATLLFFPRRGTLILLAVGAIFHVAVDATLVIPLFQGAMLCALILFLEDKNIEAFGRRILGRKK